VVLGGGTRGGQVEGWQPCEAEATRVPWRRRVGSRRGSLDPRCAAAGSTVDGQVERRQRGCLGDDGPMSMMQLFWSVRSGAVSGQPVVVRHCYRQSFGRLRDVWC
jgi:hypothetical protein